ncbi:hypothetical protein ACRAQ7_14035 [Erythrobacter sp. W53]|uniref:hypothetical protein n=1 Tax=Erythrobacteraceae TaxID=335929 RepID=UPI0036D2442A
MARKGVGFFDSKGQFFKNPEQATRSDLAALLGKIGDGESLAPGIAHTLLEKRAEIERLFAEHDAMVREAAQSHEESLIAAGNVAKLPTREVKAS